MIEKTRDGKRKIIRQITSLHSVAKQCVARVAAGRRHVRQQYAVGRIAALQLADQRRGGARFTDRHRMHPDQWRTCRSGKTAETLADMFEIRGLPPRAPP